VSKVPTDYVGMTKYLRGHLETEQGALEAYASLVDGRPDDIISYLIKKILADEERHHALFGEILNSLESKIGWKDVEPRVPSLRATVHDREALLATTDELLAVEREDAKELKALRKTWRQARGEYGLWSMLVEGAELDTEKHIRMLKYLRQLILEASEEETAGSQP